ncbi:MAG: hypothetical protein WC663_02965 [Patescibacteria group bacterium]|jgi:hypothetical protein
MKNKKVLILSLVLGGAFILTTAFASAASIWTIDNGLVNKVLTIGNKKNKGKLYVKGKISNPNKKKSVTVDDNLKVKGTATIEENLSVAGTTTINDVIDGDGLYRTPGIIKAAVHLLSNGTISKSFNKLSNEDVSSTAINETTTQLDFGADLSNEYIQLTGVSTNFSHIETISGETITVHCGVVCYITVY